MAAPKVTEKINLLPKDKLQSGLIGKAINWAVNVGRYVVVFTELIVIGAFLYRFGLDRQLTDLNEEIEQKKMVVNSYESLENNFVKLQNQLKFIGQKQTEGIKADELLEAVSQITPLDASYQTIDIQKTEIMLEGEVGSDIGLATLLSKAQSNELFEEVVLESVSTPQEETKAISFQMSLLLKDKE